MTTKIVVYYPDLTVEYLGKDIIRNFVRGSQATSDNSIIYFGVNSQYGNCCLYDRDDVVLGKILDGSITSQSLINVFVYLDNKKIGAYYAEITYSFVNKFIEFELHDSLFKWSKIKYSGFTVADIYDDPIIMPYPHDDATINGYQLYSKLVNVTQELETEEQGTEEPGVEEPSFFKPISVGSDLMNYLNSIIIEVPHIECEYLIDAWNSFCELITGALFRNEDGLVEVLVYE